MGEIGIPRREFLYDIRFWEVRRIIRGYRHRDRLKHQLLAECAYATIFAMRDPKGQTAKDLFPGIFTDEDDETDSAGDPPITNKEVKELQQLMDDINKPTPSQSDHPKV